MGGGHGEERHVNRDNRATSSLNQPRAVGECLPVFLIHNIVRVEKGLRYTNAL